MHLHILHVHTKTNHTKHIYCGHAVFSLPNVNEQSVVNVAAHWQCQNDGEYSSGRYALCFDECVMWTQAMLTDALLLLTD